MAGELVAASAGLLGTIVGAGASLATTLAVERARAARDRRQALLGTIVTALFSGDRSRAVESKLALAIVGDKIKIRGLVNADEAAAVSIALNSILLDAVNQERRSLGLESLGIDDFQGLVTARDDDS